MIGIAKDSIGLIQPVADRELERLSAEYLGCRATRDGGDHVHGRAHL